MNVKPSAPLILVGVLVVGATAARSQQRSTPASPPVGFAARRGGGGSGAGASTPNSVAPEKKQVVHVEGDIFSDRKTAAGTVLTLSGKARFQSDDSILVTDRATYNKTTSVANAPGKLQLDDSQNTIIGDRGIAYYKPKDAKITGNVHINVRPKPSDASAPEGSLRREFKQPATITCDNVDYNWRDKVAVLTGHLTLKYEDRTITAEKAVYYGNEERVDLTGNVHYSRPNGDKGVADAAIVLMKEGDEAFYIPKGTKPFTAVFEVPKDEDDTKDGTGGAATAPATPKTAPPLPPELTGTTPTPPPAVTPPPAGTGTTPAGSGTGTAPPAPAPPGGGTPKP